MLDTERPGKLAADPKVPLEIDADGAIWQQQRRLGRLSVQDFARPDLLRKEEGVYFAALPGMTPRAAKAIVSNKALEVSNVDSASASMQLVTTSREFQMLNRAYSVVSTARRGVLEQVAKW